MADRVPGMATTDAGDSRYEAFRSLAAELQVRRAGVHGARMAERLLAIADRRCPIRCRSPRRVTGPRGCPS
ncbi:hypothetical protein GCM10027435_13450 [Haloparvum alkalitolerans]